MELIIAQIIGIVALLISSLAPQQKTKKKVLIFKLFSTILYALQYLTLSAYSATVTNVIGAIRDYIFYRYSKAKKDIPIFILWIIYNLAVGAYASAIGSIVSFTSAIIAIIRLDIMKNKSRRK